MSEKSVSQMYFKNAAEVTRKFYKLISQKKYETAFTQCLSEDFQNRIWQGNVNNFIDGYKDTVKLELKGVMPVGKINDKHTECVVYYHDIKNRSVHKDLEGLPAITLDKRHKFSRRVNSFTEKAVNDMGADPKKVSTTLMRHLFSRSAATNLQFNLGISPEKAKGHFTQVEDLFRIGMRVWSMPTEQGWKIDSIRDLDQR